MSEMVRVGKVRDAHGMSGEVFVILFSKEGAWLDKATSLFFEGKAPNGEGKHELVRREYKIKSYRAHKKGAIVKLEGVTHRTDAEKLIGFSVDIEKTLLSSEKGEVIYLNEIEGFEVLNNKESIGTIATFSTNGAQDLLIVESQGKRYEIPFVKDYISEIDWENKKLFLSLPEGLLE